MNCPQASFLAPFSPSSERISRVYMYYYLAFCMPGNLDSVKSRETGKGGVICNISARVHFSISTQCNSVVCSGVCGIFSKVGATFRVVF